MCQIIAITTTCGKFKRLSTINNIIPILQQSLDQKGGEYYSIDIMVGDIHRSILSFAGITDLFKDINQFINSQKTKNKTELKLLLFSRQQPEMESKLVEKQPYIISKPSDKSGIISMAVHGTIYNDKELSSKYSADIGADTEIVKFVPEKEFDEIQGTYVIFKMGTNKPFEIINHGLKIWEKDLVIDGKFVANIISTSKINFEEISPKKESRILFASFSGGMDISLSVFKELSSGKYTEAHLNYFAWGSRAEKSELLSIESLLLVYKNYFPEINIQLDVIRAQDYFGALFNILGTSPKILNTDDDIDEETLISETERPLTYVPYRNSQFAVLLASLAESKELKNVSFLFGLNLSEGMVFMDNSEGWLESITNVIKYGGKDYKYTGGYDVISPYFARTKTNINLEFIEEFGHDIFNNLLQKSFSCYYPDEDGSPCLKCGSCVLRQKSTEG